MTIGLLFGLVLSDNWLFWASVFFVFFNGVFCARFEWPLHMFLGLYLMVTGLVLSC